MDSGLYSVKVIATRCEYSGFRFDLTPEENAEHNDPYGTTFKVVVTDRQEEVALLSGKVFDENRVYMDAQDILNVADPMRGYERSLAECMNECTELTSRAKEWDSKKGYSGYLTFCCVSEKYRGRGIATYLLRNLHLILKHALNIDVRVLAAGPRPFDPDTFVYCEDEKRQEQGIEILTNCGFHEIVQMVEVVDPVTYDSEVKKAGTGFYVRTFEVPEA